MHVFSQTAKLCSFGILSLTLIVLTSNPADAKKRSSGSSGRSANCCKVLGLYQPRLDRSFTPAQRFNVALGGSKGN